jgi:predicted extracellular nuclease
MIRTTRSNRKSMVRAVLTTALLGGALVLAPSVPATAAGPPVFINEIHYDNTSTDVGEAFEIAGPAGTDLTGWSVVLYNGATGLSYNTISLSGSIPNQQSGFGTVVESLPTNGIQNGSPDGLALLDGSNVVEFLSYEGTFTAGNGPAAGITSTDIGVAESGSTPAGDSLQKTGTGSMGGDFTWAAAQSSTFGGVNTGQTFTGGSTGPVPGDLVITEVMQDPNSVSDTFGEWFEVRNVSGSDIDIDGWTISDNGTDTHEIDNGGALLVPAAGVVVLGRSTDTAANGGAPVDYAYNDFFLGNTDDEVVLTDSGGTEFDRIEYDGGPTWPDPTGASMNLDPDSTSSTANDDGANWCEATSTYGDGDLGTPGAANDECADPEPELLFIHEIQGSGPSVAITGPVEVEAIVTSLFTRNDVLDGFFIQEEDADADGDPATSEGIFVYCRGNCPASIAPGDLVRVAGDAEEFFGMSQIDMVSGSVTNISSGNPLPTPTPVDLPASGSTVAEDTFENVEGMHVTFVDELAVSEYFQLARFGQIVLTESSRPFQFTHLNAPDETGYSDFLADLATRRIILDDDNNDNNDAIFGPAADEAYYYPEGGLALGNKFRGGDTVTGLLGVMHWSWAGSSNTDAWRIRPIPEVHDYTFDSVNPAPAAPADVGGTLQVGSFNVLNYFTTLDTGPSICGPAGSLGCRGANSAAELGRQRDKLVAAIVELDADVLGLVEIENDDDTAIADLVGALNAAAGAGTYDYIATGFIGTDAIKVGLIYQPAAVSPTGAFAILDSSVDSRFIDTKNRPVLIQTFTENASGDRFTVAVNHLKSKGSPCTDVGDPNLNDGQGNCSQTRADAAAALADFLATDPTGSGDPDVLIIGDLNAYAQEDAVTALQAAGYTDLIRLFGGSSAYSFVFDGQLGYLDHALASPSIVDRVTGVTEWHVNADEVNVFDYNDDVRDPGEASFERETTVGPIYAPDALRSSDHDPLILGLDLATPRTLKTKAARDLDALYPSGDRRDDKRLFSAINSIEASLDRGLWLDDEHLDGESGDQVFTWERKAVQQLRRVSGPAADGARAAIDLLLAADEELARRALDIAIATDGTPRLIARSEQELARAADDVAAGRPDLAINHYRRAWQLAIRAVDDARYSTFNASLNRGNAGDLARELTDPGSGQPAVIAEIVQRSRPEVLLVNEFDYDAAGLSAALFQRNYLSIGQGGADPIEYPFRYSAPSNTGIQSGIDLDNDGSAGGPGDAFGFGFFPGQFGMTVYSMHPIAVDDVRTFQNFLWIDMPGALLPEDPPGTPWYSPEQLEIFRLSSKSHWDIPMFVGKREIHFLASHPTPPVFDGPEDRNGRRNHDEIRFWADYVSGGSNASYIYDDTGGIGGLDRDDRFVIAGDQNADPFDGDSVPGAAQQLLDHPRINTKVTPSSLGGPEQAALQGNANTLHLGDPAFDTADFFDGFPPAPFGGAPGNLRVDYVLPQKNLKITGAEVFWPETSDPLFPLVGTFPFPSSDHRLVWIDINT